MDVKSRLLPHLNLCYLQKKAFEIHRRKIDNIKYSLKNSRLSLHKNRTNSQTQADAKPADDKPKYELKTIKQELKTQMDPRMSPLARRRLLQDQKQNTRLLNKIHKCTSTINRRQIQMHSVQDKKIMERLCKFKRNPTSNKTLLKCEASLEHLMERKGKGKPTQARSHSLSVCEQPHGMQRSSSVVPYSKEENGSLRRLKMGSFGLKRNSHDTFMLERNGRKIKTYFNEGRTVVREQVRMESLRSSFDQSKRRLENRTAKDVSRDRCFTTEPSSFN